MDAGFRQESWYQFLDHGMQDLVNQSYSLIQQEKKYAKPRYHDYSYILFPIAKAYEGFLKKYLYTLELIDESVLYDRYFRIGRSLNPDLPDKFKDDNWLFDDLLKICRQSQAGDLAKKLWQAWVEGRNQLFHYYFPDHVKFINLIEAEKLVDQFVTAMDQAVQLTIES